MELLTKSAQERIQHLNKALSFYDKYFSDNQEFKNVFFKLLDALILTESCQQNKINVFIIAVGKSAGVAKLAASMFVSVGLPVQFLHPTEALHGDFGSIQSNDTVIFLSNSGNSAELLALVPGLNDRDVQIFTVTSNLTSFLAKKSNYILQLPDVEEKCPLYQSPITSTVTSLVLFQLLVSASVEKRQFSLESYAKNHPGGSIGKRIFLKIDDIMSTENLLPTVHPKESFQKLVSTFTSFAKACLLVIDENKRFLGLIAERDLRKGMENFGPDVFNKTAADIMNNHPTSIQSGTLAVEALKLMTQQQPYLNVLPVLSKDGIALGVVQIQELLSLGL